MIFSEDDLLPEVKILIDSEEHLRNKVTLVGKIPKAELEAWYGAADYYLTGSHREGGSFALIEAMACGCVPIVTRIPASMKTIESGTYGYHFDAGDADGLSGVLTSLDLENREEISLRVRAHFENSLSPKAISDRMLSICEKLLER
jgi:glycosyltransferase involved in cell wall biosynthesis